VLAKEGMSGNWTLGPNETSRIGPEFWGCIPHIIGLAGSRGNIMAGAGQAIIFKGGDVWACEGASETSPLTELGL